MIVVAFVCVYCAPYLANDERFSVESSNFRIRFIESVSRIQTTNTKILSNLFFFFRYFRYRLMVSCLLFFLLVFVPYVSVVLSKWCLVCNLYNNFDTFFRCLSLFVIVRACIVYKIALSPFVCLLVAHHSLSNAKWIPKTKQNHIEKFK